MGHTGKREYGRSRKGQADPGIEGETQSQRDPDREGERAPEGRQQLFVLQH